MAILFTQYWDIMPPLGEGFGWLSSTPSIAMLATASGVEVLAYYVPGIDHALDVIASPVTVVAGTIASASVMVDLPPWRMRRWVLRWGRAVSASHWRVWFRLDTPRESIAEGWEDGTAGASPEPPNLVEMQVLADHPIIELPIFQSGALGRALAAAARNPRQRRLLARTAIAGEPARAIHDDVRWW